MTLFRTFFLTLFLFFGFTASLAHPVLPPEIIEFIENNPNVTDAEIEAFFEETYGYPITEFWEQNPDPADDVFKPSDEYLDLVIAELEEQTGKKVTDDSFFVNNAAFQALDDTNQGYVLDRALDIRMGEGGKTEAQKTADAFVAKALQIKKEGFSFTWKNIEFYIVQGIVHILEGTDHVLFVLSLLLLALPFRKLLILITLFTIAHSITLLLSGMEVFSLSAKIVEPIIAFSIFYTAISFLVSEKYNWGQSFINHAIIVFVFGLFHGMGFAGVFSALRFEEGSFLGPLLLLNIGVEIGQILIILFAFPALFWLRKEEWGKWVIRFFALGIALIALYWTLERVL